MTSNRTFLRGVEGIAKGVTHPRARGEGRSAALLGCAHRQMFAGEPPLIDLPASLEQIDPLIDMLIEALAREMQRRLSIRP